MISLGDYVGVEMDQQGYSRGIAASPHRSTTTAMPKAPFRNPIIGWIHEDQGNFQSGKGFIPRLEPRYAPPSYHAWCAGKLSFPYDLGSSTFYLQC